ncbi:MAG: energy-coupling factor transporter ATPase [Clostridia bacterium]|nr:energy-coupling factor transporter ATPase [Clostridia bacterium]
MQAVKVDKVSYKYSEKEKLAVDGVSLEIEAGEFVAVVGRNASGKSTLARMINGLIAPLSGEITVFGNNTLDEKSLFEIRKTCGIVFQNPDNQMVASIVEDDVAFGPENIGVSREEIGKRIDFALQATGTEPFRTEMASKLSGGQKQRVAIAGVLALKPKILILDESTSMLDPIGRAEVMAVVENLRKTENMTVMVITHYMDEVVGCDKVFVMADGKLLKTGTPEQIFNDKELLDEAGLELPVPAKIAEGLKRRGVDVGLPLTKEQLKERLWKLFAKT